MRVLIACEFSGVVRNAFRKRGHDAWSCDLIPSLDGDKHHIIYDAVAVAYDRKWDLMIAHPPCTRLCNSGVKHLYIGGRKCNGVDTHHWGEMEDAAIFFSHLHNAPVKRIAIENPIMHEYGKEIIGVDYAQIIQPWMHGHGEIKATCLWLKNLPLLQPSNIVSGRDPRVHFESPGMKNGLSRAQRRSIFLPGIADAMAEQWGKL